MTAEEKAKELLDKMWDVTYQDEEYLPNYEAKQCALICVDEIIKQIDGKTLTDQTDYWEEVKQEIKRK